MTPGICTKEYIIFLQAKALEANDSTHYKYIKFISDSHSQTVFAYLSHAYMHV